jgi:hypothetical protein
MSAVRRDPTGYVVPSYQAVGDPPWYHFLHGNVPGHQIDFMYRPEVPQGPLTRQHFSHLSRLLKYIEPQEGCPYAFCIGNLSRDDTQHEPGHGGLALIFGLRIQGVTDHAGRQNPPFAHGIAAIDRALDQREILTAAGVFHRHVLAAARSADWYRRYVHAATSAPSDVANVLAGYVADFADLPILPPSTLELRWTMAGAAPPPRIVIVHEDDAPFGMIASCAAKIAAVLYPSDIRWSAISSGREADVPNGVTVRLVAERHLVAADEARGAYRLEQISDDPEEIARELFGAMPVATALAKPASRGWRERYTEEAAPDGDEKETTHVTTTAASLILQPALPFRPVPRPAAPVTLLSNVAPPSPAVPRRPASTSERGEPGPDFRRIRVAPAWRGLFGAVVCSGGLIAALYLIFKNEPTPLLPAPPAPVAAETAVVPPPPSLPVVTAPPPPPATATATATVTVTATVTAPPPPPITPPPKVLKRPKGKPIPRPVFRGPLDLKK